MDPSPNFPEYPRRSAPSRLLLAGAGGLIGSALRRDLAARGCSLRRLVRGEAQGDGEVHWDPSAGILAPAAVTGQDAVIHLGGAGIADARWSARRKDLLRRSRTESTRLLAETLARCDSPPSTLLCASGVGFYGDGRGGQGKQVDETSPVGSGFLAEMARDWEAACEPARAAGIRVLHLRLGVVLAREGGALARMLPIFRLGLGGPLGSGRQPFPWIALDDLIAAIRFCLVELALAGPVNLVAPQSTSQAEFARELGRALGRPAFIPAPAFALRLLLGELSSALLEGVAVRPRRLEEAGFRWSLPRLDAALRAILGQA